MRVYNIDNKNVNSKAINFGMNSQAKALSFRMADFYVPIDGYGKNSIWAMMIKNNADKAVNFMRTNNNFEETLKIITQGVTEANQILSNINKRKRTGILRTSRAGWRTGSDWSGNIITPYSNAKKCRYKNYVSRFNDVLEHPLNNPYSDIELSRPAFDSKNRTFIRHANPKYINNAFKHLELIFNSLYDKYILKEQNSINLSVINSSVAEMRWILAHSTPWERGSDSISNVFMRSVYKAMGIKTYRLRKGISLDLEAYCTNLDDYKKNFKNYFVKKPKDFNISSQSRTQ